MISGIDGSGKTTVAEMLKKYLGESGIQNVVIVDAMKGGCYTRQLRECFDNKDEIRSKFSPELLNLTWSADLVYTYENIVKPHINAGTHVIMHRSDLCCRVYSKLFSEDDTISQKLIDTLEIQSDLHIYLDVMPDIAYRRILIRNQNHPLVFKEKIECMRKAYELYQYYLKQRMYCRVKTIDTDGINWVGNNEIYNYINDIFEEVMYRNNKITMKGREKVE